MFIEPTKGKKVAKKSGKPFKSGNIHNTIKDTAINPNTGKFAYTFEEDDSIVDCRTCYFIDYGDY